MSALPSEMTIDAAVVAIRDARNPALVWTHKTVLFSIASRLPAPMADLPTLAKDSGVSRRTLDRVLRDLEGWGMVRRMNGEGPRGETLYELDLGRIAAKPETHDNEGSHKPSGTRPRGS